MQKKIAILLILIATVTPISRAFGQNQTDIKRTYHWYFGNKSGLDFSSGTPVPITNSSMTAEEGCASISDTCGNLLFYTDGDTIWNRNNISMPNGTGLMGCWSSAQSSLIVPQPSNDSLYYIFVTDCAESTSQNGIRYSIVNMNLNSGLGDVIEKNTLLYAPSMEKLAGTYHANGNDVWILSVNKYPGGPPPDTTYQYFAYLLTNSGINPTPVLSISLMTPHKTPDGYMCFSHLGDKLANRWHSLIDTTELLEFDNFTGLLFNPIIIADSSDVGANGLTFSPDDSKLYLSGYVADSSVVVQYDLSSGNESIINSSRFIVNSRNFLTYASGALQIGSGNERIYVMGAEDDSFIDIIQNPNGIGLTCDYTPDALNLGMLQTNSVGLPNFISNYLLGNWQQPCNSGLSEFSLENGVLVYPNPSDGLFTVKGKIGIQKIEIYNSIGDIIFSKETNSTNLTVNLQNAKKGIYLIRLEQGSINVTHKIIIY